MALVKYGQGVAGMSGKLGGTIFSRGRTGAVTKNWAKPVNAMSATQTQRRATFQARSAGWGLLTDAQRDQWEAFAATQSRLNRMGDVYVPAGRQMYAECNSNLSLIGQATIAVPPVGEVPPAIDPALTLTVTEAAGVLATMIVVGGAADATVLWYVKAAPAQMTGRSNVQRQMRTIGSFAAGATLSIKNAYAAVFGTVTPLGSRTQIMISAIDKTSGLSSVKLLVVGTATV